MAPLDFIVDEALCTGCEQCVKDCPLLVLAMEEGKPAVIGDRAKLCINCQHCLTICPVGAVSIHGVNPDECLKIKGMFPESVQMETLIRGRRSVRRYKDENIAPEAMERLLQVAWQAPTGVNARGVLFTVVDNRETMNRLRSQVMERLAEIVQADELPAERNFFAGFVKQWEKGIDILFRGAPHLIITSAPKSCPCPEPDCLIALSYFELFAQSMGLGTVWDGLAKWTFTELMPEFQTKLGIPEDHLVGYVMVFGKPAVKYPRTGSLRPANINRAEV